MGHHFKLESTVKEHPAYVREVLPTGVFPTSQPYSHDRSTKWGDNTRWIVYSPGREFFNHLHEKWYEQYDGGYRKVVPDDLELSETALLHWYFGDGCPSKRVNGAYRLHFSTHGFPTESIDRLQFQLDEFGYETYTS